MTNFADRPNHVHVCGDSTFGASFGALYSVTAVNLLGTGHHIHLDARFKHGVKFELTVDDATRLERELHLALATLPTAPDCSGIAAELGGNDV
jgi:hypothetical protein